MNFDGAYSHTQFLSNLPVGKSTIDQSCDFPPPPGQRS
jgi:hypothetical protein